MKLDVAGLWRGADGGVLVGIRFTMSPQWHIYWSNPGESGMKPSFTAHAPAGWTAGTTIYTRPDVIRHAGETTFGYEKSAVLIVPVSAGPEAQAGTLTIDVRYLACKEICLLGDGKVSVELPGGGAIQSLEPLPAVLDGRSVPTALDPKNGRAIVEGNTLRIKGRFPEGVSTPEARFLPFELPGFSVAEGLASPGVVTNGVFSLTTALSLEVPTDKAQPLVVGGLVTFGTLLSDPCTEFTLKVPIEGVRK